MSSTDSMVLSQMSLILDGGSTSSIPLRDLTEVIEGLLYMSGGQTAANTQTLHFVGITHVMSCCPTDLSLQRRLADAGINWVGCDAQDEENYDIMQHVPLVLEQLRAAQAVRGKLLVHCGAGVNRSGALVVAALISHTGASLLPALQFVKAQRQYLLTNQSFRTQLLHWVRQRPSLDSIGIRDWKNNRTACLVQCPETDDFASLEF
jgi:hypothetical protein